MLKLIPLLMMLWMLSACHPMEVRDEASPRFRVPVGSQFVLKQALEVPAGHARVFLQQGEVVAKRKLDLYQPHCNFEVRSVSDGKERIETDTFTVTAVMEDEEDVVKRPDSENYAFSMASADGMGIVILTRFVKHALHSEGQPQVMNLTCHGGFAEAWQVTTPSIHEIRQALGDIVILKMDEAP